MKRADNWIMEKTPMEIVWTHKHNRQVTVSIQKQTKSLRMAEYLVRHTHPTHKGVIMQPPEGAKFMKTARDKAYVHLYRWNDPGKWDEH